MTDKETGYSGEKASSISPATERAAARRTKYNLTNTLYDFVEWLGTRSETVTFGVNHKSVASQPLVDEYVAARGLRAEDDAEWSYDPTDPQPANAPNMTPGVLFDGSEPRSPSGGEATSSENVHLPPGRGPINEIPGASDPGNSSPEATSPDAVTTVPEDAPPEATGNDPAVTVEGTDSTQPTEADSISTVDPALEAESTPNTDDEDVDWDDDGLDDESEIHQLLDQHHATVASKVSKMNNVDRLNALRDAEASDKARESVLHAIDSRLETIDQGV